jgi:hypothetical protein
MSWDWAISLWFVERQRAIPLATRQSLLPRRNKFKFSWRIFDIFWSSLQPANHEATPDDLKSPTVSNEHWKLATVAQLISSLK